MGCNGLEDREFQKVGWMFLKKKRGQAYVSES